MTSQTASTDYQSICKHYFFWSTISGLNGLLWSVLFSLFSKEELKNPVVDLWPQKVSQS